MKPIAYIAGKITGDPTYREKFARAQEVLERRGYVPQRVKYFVIHPTSVDDAVEWWFRRKRLCSWDKFVCEFTLLEDKKVVGFSTNLEMCKGDN